MDLSELVRYVTGVSICNSRRKRVSSLMSKSMMDIPGVFFVNSGAKSSM